MGFWGTFYHPKTLNPSKPYMGIIFARMHACMNAHA